MQDSYDQGHVHTGNDNRVMMTAWPTAIVTHC